MSDGIAALVGIDMETDVGSWTPEWTGLVQGTPKLLDLFDARGLEATFYFTGESAEKYPEVVRAVRDRGHEVGCHSLYHETVGEEMFPLPGVHPLLPAEVRPRLEMATRIVENAAGSRPVSFRAPRLWGSNGMVNALEALGYVADLTYPLFFHRKQCAPYHPSSADWREKGDLKILEIPNFADMSMESHDPHGRDRDQWPLLRTQGAGVLLRKAESFVALVRSKGLPPVLSFYFHPWEFVPLKPVYAMSEASIAFAEFLTMNTGDAALAGLDALMGGLERMGARFSTAQAFAEAGGRP